MRQPPYRCDDTRGCVMQFWPPDDEHMCSKHVVAWNKLIVKQKSCASSWLISEIKNFLLYTIKIVYCQGDVFRPLLGHLQALWEHRSKSYLYFICIVGSQMLTDCVIWMWNAIVCVYWNLCGCLSIKRLKIIWGGVILKPTVYKRLYLKLGFTF